MISIPKAALNETPVDQMSQEFTAHGCLQVDRFLPEGFAHELHQQAESVFSKKTGVSVGNLRQMIPVPIKGAFADPSIFGGTEIHRFLSSQLGENVVLDSFTMITAFPGAGLQHRHRDFERLFTKPVEFFDAPYAVNLFIPLVDLNAENGTTRLWPGTHRKPIELDSVCEEDAVDPDVPVGSALIADYRLIHEGRPNHSLRPRPVLCLAFVRPWFYDYVHFRGINRLNISEKIFKKMNSPQQQLFARAAAQFSPEKTI